MRTVRLALGYRTSFLTCSGFHGRSRMKAVRIETTIGENGEVHLAKLPFPTGARVEVIVLPRGAHTAASERFPLRGTPVKYDRPTDPVSEEEWSALR